MKYYPNIESKCQLMKKSNRDIYACGGQIESPHKKSVSQAPEEL